MGFSFMLIIYQINVCWLRNWALTAQNSTKYESLKLNGSLPSKVTYSWVLGIMTGLSSFFFFFCRQKHYSVCHTEPYPGILIQLNLKTISTEIWKLMGWLHGCMERRRLHIFLEQDVSICCSASQATIVSGKKVRSIPSFPDSLKSFQAQ